VVRERIWNLQVASEQENDEAERFFLVLLNQHYFNLFNSQPLDLILTHVKHLYTEKE
jgi:hypothetical protein